jgi:hypothetical protein
VNPAAKPVNVVTTPAAIRVARPCRHALGATVNARAAAHTARHTSGRAAVFPPTAGCGACCNPDARAEIASRCTLMRRLCHRRSETAAIAADARRLPPPDSRPGSLRFEIAAGKRPRHPSEHDPVAARRWALK